VPEQRQITIFPVLKDNENLVKITNCYTVESIEERETRMLKELPSGDSERPVVISVRTDLIPPPSRIPGNKIRLTGTPLEIELFEESLSKRKP